MVGKQPPLISTSCVLSLLKQQLNGEICTPTVISSVRMMVKSGGTDRFKDSLTKRPWLTWSVKGSGYAEAKTLSPSFFLCFFDSPISKNKAQIAIVSTCLWINIQTKQRFVSSERLEPRWEELQSGCVVVKNSDIGILFVVQKLWLLGMIFIFYHSYGLFTRHLDVFSLSSCFNININTFIFFSYF